LSALNRSDVILVAGATVIIVFTILITAALQSPPAFSQIITVGPVWNADSWVCTSDANFVVDAALRGFGDSQLAITVSDGVKQSLYSLVSGQMQTFSVGGTADVNIVITRTGTVTGFITLETAPGATASCTQR